MNRLRKALTRLLGHSELASPLARVLGYACKSGRISYGEVEKIVGDDLEDVLLLGNKWRLLIPTRIVKSSAWEDRPLVAKAEEVYEVPNIIRYLAEDARKTGRWEAGRAIAKLFRDMGEPNWEQMPKLVEWLEKQAKDNRITAAQIKMVCNELGLGDRVDALIAELKGSGVMSPKLGPLAEVSRAGMPIYELNPSVFTNKGRAESNE